MGFLVFRLLFGLGDGFRLLETRAQGLGSLKANRCGDKPSPLHWWQSLRNIQGSLKRGKTVFRLPYCVGLCVFVGEDETGAYAVGLVL